MNLIKLSFSTLALSTLLFAGNYKIDSSSTKASFLVKYLNNEEIKGEFGEITGSFVYDDKKSNISKMEAKIKLDSLDMKKDDFKAYILSEKIFDTKKYPEIKFTATKIEEDRVFGDLTIKNVTKNIELDFENSGDFFGKIYLKISGKIKRSYFDLTWDELLDIGSSAVSNDIIIDIDVLAEKEEDIKFTKIFEKTKK